TPPLVNSPLLGILFPGDIITSIDKVDLGDYHDQVAPTLVTQRTYSSTTTSSRVLIKYRTTASGYEQTGETTVQAAIFPPEMDYPWYIIHNTANLPNSTFRPAF